MGNAETRMRANARDPQYHPVLILWPNNNASSKCAEINYAEGTTETAQMKFFLHHASGGSDFQTTTSTPIDPTQWHNYAVEWTPSGITGYIDGVKTFTDSNPAHQPGVGMHQTLQLDWFPNGGATKPSQMQIDWVRVYKWPDTKNTGRKGRRKSHRLPAALADGILSASRGRGVRTQYSAQVVKLSSQTEKTSTSTGKSSSAHTTGCHRPDVPFS